MPDDSLWDDANVSERETASLPVDADGADAVAATAPSRSETSVIKTTEDVVRVLAERGKEVVVTSAPSDERPSSPRSARSRKKEVPKGDGRCGAYAPRGTKCKLCGKVHP